MEQALTGLVGLLVGVLVNEYIRRRKRIEDYAAKVFEKRLDVYAALMGVIREAENDVNETLEDDSEPVDERCQQAFAAGLRVMEYCDQNSLFLNDEITVHCGAAFGGVTDIIPMEKGSERDEQVLRYRTMLGDAKAMIRAESGMTEIDRSFRAVSKANHSSAVIDYYRNAKAKRDSAH